MSSIDGFWVHKDCFHGAPGGNREGSRCLRRPPEESLVLVNRMVLIYDMRMTNFGCYRVRYRLHLLEWENERKG